MSAGVPLDTVNTLGTQSDGTSIFISDVRSLLILLRSPEPSVVITAIEALNRFASNSPKHKTNLLQLSIVNPLLLLCRDNATKKAAVACLAVVTNLTDFHPDMRKRELLDTLIRCLDMSEPADVQDESAAALANLSRDFSNKADVRKYGGIRALVKVMDVNDPDVKKNAGLALSTLLEDFANRTEVRMVGGIAPLAEFLSSDYFEIRENALMSLLKAAEDSMNREEIRKVGGIKKLIDLLTLDLPESHPLALQLMALCLEDDKICMSLPDNNGIPVMAKLCSSEDYKIKKFAEYAIYKAARNDRNRSYIRDANIVNIMMSNLNSPDLGCLANACLAISNLAKNEIIQLEFTKLNILDVMTKLLAHDDAEVVRQTAAALTTMFNEAKVRSKIKSVPDLVQALLKILNHEDTVEIVNTCECIANLSEDLEIRSEFIRAGAVGSLVQILYRADVKMQAASALTMARLMQDIEGNYVLAKQPGFPSITRMIELLSSRDIHVCRNVSYALANAIQNDVLAAAACKLGALEALIEVAKDTTRSSTKFAVDALDKLLNQYVSAKYWLRNQMTGDNLIKDGFYDVGFAGPNLEAIQNFPSLPSCVAAHIDKKREVIHVDIAKDSVLEKLSLIVAERISVLSPKNQIKLIASLVALSMGGTMDPQKVNDFGYKFRITDLKMHYKSNVIPLGSIDQGTFYHRALLFKALCDRVGLYPCTVQRGDYNRAWNVVDLRKMGPTPGKSDVIARVMKTLPSNIVAVDPAVEATPSSAAPASIAPRVPSAGSKKGGLAAAAPVAEVVLLTPTNPAKEEIFPVTGTEMKESTLDAISNFLKDFDAEMGCGGAATNISTTSSPNEANMSVDKELLEASLTVPQANGGDNIAAGVLDSRHSTPASKRLTTAAVASLASSVNDIYDAVVIDLMYEPGQMLPLGSNEAIGYQRMA